MHQIERRIEELLKNQNLNEALKLIYLTVENIVTEALCTSLILNSKRLDLLCTKIGKKSFKNLLHITPAIQSSQKEKNTPVVVYIVTKLQQSGGHTRVIQSMIQNQPNAQHIILSTNLMGRGYFSHPTDFQPISVTVEKAKGNYYQRLLWLQKKLLILSPEKVFLFNHHQDSVAVAAIQPDMKLNAMFCHHGDHHLSLGIHLSHLQHIDFQPVSYFHCKNQLGLKNVYLPLTTEDKNSRSSKNPFMSTGVLTTCTAARFNKLEVPYFISYTRLIPALLKVTGGTHIHIGRLSPIALLNLRICMKKYGLSKEQFCYIPYVKSVWQALLTYNVDLYVASFPLGGGLTLVEAMGAGVPICVHQHIYSPLLGGSEIAPYAFTWQYPSDLLTYCSTVTPDKLNTQAKLGRRHFETFHTPASFQYALEDISTHTIEPPARQKIFSIEEDEWGYLITRQINFKYLLTRAAHRFIRKVKTVWT